MRNMKCPACGHEMHVEIRSVLPKEQQMSFRIVPGENGMLSADTVGSSLAQMQKLLQAVGKQHGQKVNVLVSGVKYEDGAVTVDLLMAVIK